MAQPIQQRHDTAAAFTAANTVLLPGQIGVETDTGKMKAGVNAGTAWNSLSYVGGSGSLIAYPMREPFGYAVPAPGDTAITSSGGAFTPLDSSVATARAPSATSLMTHLQRVAYVGPAAEISRNAGGTTATASANLRVPDPAIVGGFRLRIAATISDLNPNGQFGIGFWGQTESWSPSTEPSSRFNGCFLGGDSGDANLSIMHNGASGSGNATKVALGASFPNNRNMLDLYELLLDFHSNGSTRTLLYEARNLASGVVVTGSIPDTAKMPTAGVAVTTFFCRGSCNVATAPSIEFYGAQVGPLA